MSAHNRKGFVTYSCITAITLLAILANTRWKSTLITCHSYVTCFQLGGRECCTPVSVTYIKTVVPCSIIQGSSALDPRHALQRASTGRAPLTCVLAAPRRRRAVINHGAARTSVINHAPPPACVPTLYNFKTIS